MFLNITIFYVIKFKWWFKKHKWNNNLNCTNTDDQTYYNTLYPTSSYDVSYKQNEYFLFKNWKIDFSIFRQFHNILQKRAEELAFNNLSSNGKLRVKESSFEFPNVFKNYAENQ